MSEQQTILITGASGLLGANLARHYAQKSKCFGWYGSNPVDIAGVIPQRIDITDQESVLAAIAQIQPDIIIHCAAATNVEWCEKNPALAKKINEDASEFLAKTSSNIDAKFVYTSSDSVFDGKTGNYSESDQPSPLNSYAAGKVRSEELVAASNPDAMIIRSYFYGHSPSGSRSLLEWVLVRAQVGNEVPGFTDSYFSPISVHDFATAIDTAIDSDHSGLLHLGSSERMSKYEFARLVMEAHDCDMSLLKPITVNDAGLKADRPRDTSLNVDLQASILATKILSVAEGIERISLEPNPFQ
ncbi:sugar nucleotide-binding protein [SAR202 cluster bacterium JH702]|uniref:dTDP-4-dehydrorhamnose reductase n=1 Tax=Candidatus Lucifugimonas marina TaxID=3038979 RepID=A0ABD4XPA9_9CHLR|nr:sugar nucleotide-binding protein [SAR202 cluster bacterium JH702]